MVKPALIAGLTIGLITLLNVTPINAKEHQDLRLYRVNKDGLSDRFWFTRRKARKAGCHNIRKRSRLHRAVQFGYATCRVYTKKNCAEESVLNFTRNDDATPTTDLLQGYSWFTVSDHKRGERVKSWHCTDNINHLANQTTKEK